MRTRTHAIGAVVMLGVLAGAWVVLHQLAISTSRGDGPDHNQITLGRMGVAAVGLTLIATAAGIAWIVKRRGAKPVVWIVFAIVLALCTMQLLHSVWSNPHPLCRFDCNP